MAAANTDYFIKGTRRFSTTIGAAGVADASVTTIPLTSVSGLPTDTAVEIVIDRVSSGGTATPLLEEVVRGVISGSNVTSSVRGVEGTAQAHAAGAIVEVRLTADQWNRAMTGLLVDHNQAGTHKLSANYDSNGNETQKWAGVSSAVNEITATNAATGTAPFISATGGDTNINLDLKAKGTGAVRKPVSVSIQIAAGTTDLTTGDGKFYFTVPPELNGMVLSAVYARVVTAGTTGTTDIQLHNVTDAVDILSTKLTIDSGETGSDTAAAAAVINTSNDDMATNDLIRIDIDAVSTTAPKGLIVRLTFGF